LPGSTDDALVRSGRTANFSSTTGNQTVRTIGVGGASTAGTLNVAGDDVLNSILTGASTFGLTFGNGTGSGLLTQTGATIDIDGNVGIAFNANTGSSSNTASGIYNQSGGTLLVGGDMRLATIIAGATNKTMTATYNVSGAAVVDVVGGLFVGENQASSTNTANGNLSITGSNASISIGRYFQANEDAALTYTADADGISTIHVDDGIQLGGTLTINLAALADAPPVLLLLENISGDPIIGSFANVSEGQMFGDYIFTYQHSAGGGNSVALFQEQVPEPGALSAMLVAGVVCLVPFVNRRLRWRSCRA
jgi:hypothetical protein